MYTDRYFKAFNLFYIHEPHVYDTSSVKCRLLSVLQVNNATRFGCYALESNEGNSVS